VIFFGLVVGLGLQNKISMLWFAGGACLLVWLVLHDTRLDYRVLIAGALLPEVVGVYAHSVLVSVVVLFAVMLVRTACGHRTDTLIPWWWWVTASHSASATAACLVTV